MVDNIDPIVPEGTPLPTPPVGVPPYPITPFAVWTWDSPVIPSFYWNIYSSEQRVKLICKEIGKIEAYLNYLVNKTNENLIDLQSQITKLDARLTALEKKLEEEVARLDALIAKLREDLTAETKARQDADTALDTKITSESTKLHGEISTETQNRIHADDALHTEISNEAKAREDADTDLEARVRADLATETQAREAGDSALGDRIASESEKLHGEISKEVQDRTHADDSLHGEISQEVQDRQAADTTLKAALEKEISDGDSALHTDLATETQARKDADAALETKLAGEISTEAKTREDADKALGERITAEVSKEVQDRTHADDGLHGEISTETQARQDADSTLEAKLTNEIAKRLLPTEVTAGEEISITQPDPSSNRIVIASTVAHSISDLRTSVSGVKAALEAEVSERRAEDTKLWQAVNQRIERGKILAGTGIKVENDPDATTVTISSKVTESNLAAVEAKAEAATTTAGEAKSTAEAASTAATEAKNTADTASTTAGEAKTTADAASTTAGEAKTTAEAAQTAAGEAKSKAEEALTAAQGSLKAVAHTASLAGDGTSSTPLSLTPATATTLGGVKIGSGLAVTEDGTLSATTQGGGTGGMSEVAHDSSLSGNGTSSSPLGVSLYQFGGLQNNSNGISIHDGEGLYLNADNNTINAYVTTSKLEAVDSKATEAKTAAQEAKTAVDGKLSTVSVSGPITGNGTASSPLNVETGVGLTVSNGKLVSTVHSIGVAVVRCNIDSFSLAKGESKTVSKDFAGIQGRVIVHGLSGEGHLIAVIPDTSANANLAGAVASVRVNGSSSGDGTYTITKVTATIYAAANELQNINSFGITLLFSDTSSYASYQDIPQAR